MRVLLVVEIDNASDAARIVRFEAIRVGIRPNFAAPATLGKRDHTHKRAGLRSDFATKAPTKAALHTSAASGTRLRKNRHRRGKRMPAKLASSAFENYTGR